MFLCELVQAEFGEAGAVLIQWWHGVGYVLEGVWVAFREPTVFGSLFDDSSRVAAVSRLCCGCEVAGLY